MKECVNHRATNSIQRLQERKSTSIVFDLHATPISYSSFNVHNVGRDARGNAVFAGGHIFVCQITEPSAVSKTAYMQCIQITFGNIAAKNTL
jgi:hypothetical protein